MDIRTAFPSPWLKGVDLGDKQYKLTIKDARMEELQGDGGKEHKPALFFNETDKGLVLNVTNSDTLAMAWGWDTDQWLGKQVIVYFDPTIMFGRERKGGIRVKADTPSTAQIAQAPQSEALPAPTESVSGGISTMEQYLRRS